MRLAVSVEFLHSQIGIKTNLASFWLCIAYDPYCLQPGVLGVRSIYSGYSSTGVVDYILYQ
jgi:hypothetical protein